MYIFVPSELNAMPVGVESWPLTEKETESYEAKERSKKDCVVPYAPGAIDRVARTENEIINET